MQLCRCDRSNRSGQRDKRLGDDKVLFAFPLIFTQTKKTTLMSRKAGRQTTIIIVRETHLRILFRFLSHARNLLRTWCTGSSERIQRIVDTAVRRSILNWASCLLVFFDTIHCRNRWFRSFRGMDVSVRWRQCVVLMFLRLEQESHNGLLGAACSHEPAQCRH